MARLRARRQVGAAIQQPQGAGVQGVEADARGDAILQRPQAGTEQPEDQPQRHGDDAQDQRRGDAGPQRQRHLDLVAVGGRGRVGEEGCQALRLREQAERERQQRRDERHRDHPAGRFVRVDMGIARLAEEGVPDQHAGLGQDQRTGGHDGRREECDAGRRDARMRHRGQQRLFGQEAEHGRQAGHRERGDRAHGKGERHGPAQPAQPAQVARARLVIHDADGQEQRRLVERVRHHADHQRLERGRGVAADQHHQHAKLADGGIGQQRLKIVLLKPQVSAGEHRHQPEAGEQPEPGVGQAQGWVHARQQIDAGLDHRRRVQVRAGRGGRGHRVGQPDVRGDLCALGERAERHQPQHHAVKRAAAEHIAAAEDGGIVHAARSQADEEQPSQQRDPAAAGDKERLERAPPRRLIFVFVGDQQKRGEAGAFPEDEERDHIAGQQHAQHHGHEEEQIGQETPCAVVALEVVAGVDHHQRPDP